MHNVSLEHLEETFDITPEVNGTQAKARKASIEAAVRETLEHIGEDPGREGLLRTPERVARMYDELTAGYHTDPVKLINDAVFDVDYDEMVIVKDIDFHSLCEHHMVPFTGRVQHGEGLVGGEVHRRIPIARHVDTGAAAGYHHGQGSRH